MGFRFFKRFSIFPGLSVNISKSGISFSFGLPGAKFTIGKTGVRKTLGFPGTGVYYTRHDPLNKSKKNG